MKTALLACSLLLASFPAFAADHAADALARGKISLNVRARHEGVSQTGLDDAAALTLRTRFGFTTGEWQGWKAMLEAENITAADGDRYNQAGLNPAAARRAVVADPETTELNQALFAYTFDRTTATIGRQRLVLDNARFIGDVGWRQNMQTFDAASVQNTTLAQTALTYAYLRRINRVFGDRHAQGRWHSDSHVMHAARSGLPAGGTLAAYGYLLDFDNAAANSCATWGLSYAGTVPLSAAVKFSFRLEAARQSDYRSSALRYDTAYYAVESGLTGKPGSVNLGYEVLGSDNNVGFKTPLATLHAFNGWADLFLTTPAAGLRDTYVKATAALPRGFALIAFYHRFETETTQARLGGELDVQISRKFGSAVTAAAKLADFRRDSPALPDVRKIWFQVEYSY